MMEILKTEFFVLMNGNSQEVTNEQMQHAYGKFMEYIRTISQSDLNYPDIYRMLSNTRIELVFLQSLYRYEQGKKCPKIRLPSKSSLASRI